MFGVGLLPTRALRRARAAGVAHAHRRIASERLARTPLALRDFTNTPLQTIELAANIVRQRCPDVAPVVDRIDRCIDRLYRLNHAFSVYESQIEWTDEEVSPDPTVLVDH